jgi:PAS domain S-box-containing protein
LDDFGTGYSSLTYLQSLPFDELKVDQSFVNSMLQRRESRKIVAAVVGLGRSLGLTTVAEGIEEEGQAEMLSTLGCELGQGWLYGKAVSSQEVIAIASGWREETSGHQTSSREACDHHLCLEAFPSAGIAQLQAIYDGAPVGLSFLDCDLRYVSLNRRLSEMNGLPIQCHLGRTVEEVVPDIFRQVRPYLERARAGESIAGFEVKKTGRQGSREPSTLLVSYQPARDEAGEVVGISVAVSEISESRNYLHCSPSGETKVRATPHCE